MQCSGMNFHVFCIDGDLYQINVNVLNGGVSCFTWFSIACGKASIFTRKYFAVLEDTLEWPGQNKRQSNTYLDRLFSNFLLSRVLPTVLHPMPH